MIKRELLDILACPQCKGPVKFRDDALICEKCMLLYKVKNDIPVMLIEEAESLDKTQ